MRDVIEIRWSILDVQNVDESLTDEQSRKVLERLRAKHDDSIGINWDVIEDTITIMKSTGEL